MPITLHDIDSSVHNIAIKSTSGTELALDGSGFITANVNGTVTVSATNLDIRDLTSASDSVEIKTAAGQALDIDGSGFLTVNVNGSVVVTATNLDIRDLTHASDSVKVGDGTDFLAINTDGSINTSVVEAGISSWKNTNQTVNTTASELAATPFTGRVKMIIQNLSAIDAYLGFDNTVTTSNGIILPGKSTFEFPYNATANVWAITASSSADIRIGEYAN